MFAKPAVVKHARLLVPAVAVSLAYVGIVIFPKHREISHAMTAKQQKRAAVENLIRRVSLQRVAAQSDRDVPMGPLGSLPEATTHVTSVGGNKQSLIGTFGELLVVFRERRIVCTGSEPKEDDPVASRDRVATQRMSLVGSFPDILSALEVVEASLPQATVVDLAMQRPLAAESCDWNIAFLIEVPR